MLLNHNPEATPCAVLAGSKLSEYRESAGSTCQTAADTIKGKAPDEIRKTFNIKDEFTPEEEEEIRRENQWAFE